MSHATPASFGSHVKSRKLEPAIAEQLIANRINVLFGGGRKYFLPKSDPNSGRKDDVDLIAQAREAGYTYVQTASELRSIDDSHVLGLFQFDALTTAEPEPSLALLTRKAIRVLKRANLEFHRRPLRLLPHGRGQPDRLGMPRQQGRRRHPADAAVRPGRGGGGRFRPEGRPHPGGRHRRS